MASVDGQRFSDNTSGDGDEYKCECCSNLGLVKEADRFCRECVEYMCVSCAEIHVSFRALRNHTVVCCGEEHSFINKKVASSAKINVPGHRYITGSTITPDGRLILVDNARGQIILLDKHFTIQSTLTLQGAPWDVAADGDNDVIVSTMGISKQLQWIHVDGGLRAGHTVTTSHSCWGVAVYSGHIYISVMTGDFPTRTKYPSLGHVEVLTRDGSVVRRIGVDSSGAGTLTVGASGTLYFADWTSEGHVTCFSSTGGNVYDVTHSDMQYPRGMVVDDDGNLLVCCQHSNNVHVLAKDGSHNRTILTSADGLAWPLSMAYRRSDGTLIVTMNDIQLCRAYKLK